MKFTKKKTYEGKEVCKLLGIVPPMSINHAKFSEDKTKVKMRLINKLESEEFTIVELDNDDFMKRMKLTGKITEISVTNSIFDSLSESFGKVVESERKLVIKYEGEL